ncbi:nitrilase-related carbon-nitrogen hydrolase, partial [Thermus scotoductus]|uniref:nitrilase-related carbon-nitrogen hydrolase n=1 Tax=Thermus scotoductus TaxID=37636 RepID=UPI0026495C53
GWVALEWLTEQGDLAFPWGFLGYSLVEAPGRVLAAWGGVYLLSLLALLVAWGLRERRYWILLPWGVLWLLPLPPEAGPERALLVQGNVNPLAKVQGGLDQEVYLRLTREGLAQYPEARLVVWPETAVWQIPEEAKRLLQGRFLLTGLNLYGPNRAVLYQEGRVLGHYDKVRLVPFGERFPFRETLGGVYGFFFRAFGLGELADRMPGDRLIPLGPYGAMICYESVFPSVARTLAREGALRSTRGRKGRAPKGPKSWVKLWGSQIRWRPQNPRPARNPVRKPPPRRKTRTKGVKKPRGKGGRVRARRRPRRKGRTLLT